MTAQTPAQEELIEKLAAVEHQRWADWQKWCNKVLRQELGDSNQIEKVLVRWDRQIATPYAELSEQEKQSDRDQVMRSWPLVQEAVAQATKEAEVAARVDERENMKFVCDDGKETHIPFNLYRYTGDGLLLTWEEREKQLAALRQPEGGQE